LAESFQEAWLKPSVDWVAGSGFLVLIGGTSPPTQDLEHDP
jgi:hypothetical protein